MSSRVTIADVARAAGVHPSNVSRALNPGARGLVFLVVVTRVVEAAEARLAEAGHVAILANTNTDAAREALLIEGMSAYLVDGIMLASVARGSTSLEICANLRIPLGVDQLPATGRPCACRGH